MLQITENNLKYKYEYPRFRTVRVKHTTLDRVRRYGRSGMSFDDTLSTILDCFEGKEKEKK